MQASPELGQVLVAAVAEHDWASPPSQLERLMVGLDPAEIVKASVCHGVAGCVHLSTSGLAGTDDQFRTALARAYQAAVASHLRTVAELGAIAPVLDAAGVPWAVVKGPVLSEAVYARPDLRDYVDLDLVVRPSGLGAALDALEDAGCVLLERNWRHLRSARPGEVALALPNGTRVDLHWHLLYHPSLRRQFSVPMDVILDRCRSVDIRGLAVRTLDRHGMTSSSAPMRGALREPWRRCSCGLDPHSLCQCPTTSSRLWPHDGGGAWCGRPRSPIRCNAQQRWRRQCGWSPVRHVIKTGRAAWSWRAGERAGPGVDWLPAVGR